MRNFTFDIPLLASITVTADSPEIARKMLEKVLDCATTNFGAYDNGDPAIGEVSLSEDIDIENHLAMVDGVDCIGQYRKRTANG